MQLLLMNSLVLKDSFKIPKFNKLFKTVSYKDPVKEFWEL